MAVVVPDLSELFEEAFERAGLEMRSGYDLKTIRRSLNMLTIEWQNRGLNLFTIESGTQVLTAGTATYSMPTDTVDLIETQLRTGAGTSQRDTHIERVSVSTYAKQSSKNMTGRPTQVFVQRLPTEVTATLWPVPDSAETYTFSYYRLKGIDGLEEGTAGSAAIPQRFIPALVSGLAYHIAMKKPEAMARILPLKELYEEQFSMAASEDEDRNSVRFVPYVGRV